MTYNTEIFARKRDENQREFFFLSQSQDIFELECSFCDISILFALYDKVLASCIIFSKLFPKGSINFNSKKYQQLSTEIPQANSYKDSNQRLACKKRNRQPLTNDHKTELPTIFIGASDTILRKENIILDCDSPKNYVNCYLPQRLCPTVRENISRR